LNWTKCTTTDERFEVVTAVKLQFHVFWAVTHTTRGHNAEDLDLGPQML